MKFFFFSEMISKPEGDIMITGNAFNFLDDGKTCNKL